ncbi:hypothetical protein [Schinkia azotoformans]|uniref:hypothetical protein n=1 Tax=Schinkia azotoformans TaxID=1454 RepID=UPI002DB95A68|nr:hypothetical protein [Schinkia azotoformans]MEC1747899.1 hypothetical protein [Schinkia azotoformans]
MNNLQYFVANFYEQNDKGYVTIVETEKQGEAELTVHSDKQAISFRIKAGNGFTYLAIPNTPDGLVFVKDENNDWTLHIFECKKTVTEKSWDKAKKQFAGGILNAHMLRGLLNVSNFASIKVYTVFREDKLLENTQDPSLLRQQVGVRIDKPRFIDWKEPNLSILWYGKVEHTPIRLDSNGIGEFRLE